MAFDKTQLQNDLYSAFTDMGDKATIREFAYGVSDAVRDFVRTGKVSTTDGGTVPMGAFTGEGTEELSGNSTVSSDACAGIIVQACENMNGMTSGGDDYLAVELGKAIKKMADDIVITTSVTGTVTPPSSSPISPYPPGGGTAKGKIACSEAQLVQALKTLFAQMWSKRGDTSYDGNLEFAKKLADEIYTFYILGAVTTAGEGELSGSAGAGTVS